MAANDAITLTHVDDFIPELWANRVLGMLPSYLNLGRTVNRDFDNVVATEGDTINITKRGTLTANQKTAGEDVTRQRPQGSKIPVTLDQHWEVSFTVENIAEAQSKTNVMDGYVEDGVIVLAEQIEEKLALLYPNAGDSVDAGASVGDDDLLAVRKKLVDAKLPKLAPRYGYFDSNTVNDILALDKFTKVSDYGANAAISDGELGNVYGIKIFEAQNVQSAGSPSVIHNMVYGRDAMVLAMRPLPQMPEGVGVKQAVISDEELGLGVRVSYSWDKDALGMAVTLDVLFGVAMMRDEFLIDLQRNA